MEKKKVLVVEDYLILRKLIRDIFEDKGYEVILESDGKMGLERAIAETPDLVLTDINMPIMNGIELYKILKGDTKTKGIPVVCMSSQDYGGACKEEGIDFLDKSNLVNGIGEIIDKYLK